MNASRIGGFLFAFLLLMDLGPLTGRSQPDSFTKNFKQFQNAAPGVDFFAGDRADIVPFEKHVIEAQRRLASFLGDNLAKGAIVVCSTLEQRDSVNETRILKKGYRWVLTQLTPGASNQQMLAQVKSRTGGQVPQRILERLQSPSPEMRAAAEARIVSSTIQRFGYAVISMTLAVDKEFRSSRLDDMGRSPLSDWLDIGLAAYAAGSAGSNLKFLQDHLDEAFPIEDLFSMSRPFIAPQAEGSGGSSGPGMVIRIAGGPGPEAPGGTNPPEYAARASRGPSSISMPKDVQDRLTFDAQAASFFAYLVQKAGTDRARELVQWNRHGNASHEFVTRPDVFGPELDKVEQDWRAWVKAQKAETPEIRVITSPNQPRRPPQ